MLACVLNSLKWDTDLNKFCKSIIVLALEESINL